MNREIKITFITPCFCRGADCSENGAPEIRPPSIRGQLHWWFRVLGGMPAEENAIFGSIHGGAKASKVVVRVRYPLAPATAQAPTLPHKQGGPAASKNAIAPGTSFDLLISTRLGGLTDGLDQKFTRALDAWLHLGTLGLRATRAAGSFIWDASPETADEYQGRISELTNGSQLKAAMLTETFNSAEEARKLVSDTLGGRDDYQGDQSLRNIRYPLGGIGRDVGGRKTSPLRFRIVQLVSGFCIVAAWDNREAVTRNRRDDLQGIVRLLEQRKPRLGPLLAGAFFP